MNTNTPFDTTEAVKEAFNIEGVVEVGESSYVKFIEHQINAASSIDSAVTVQVGKLTGNVIYVDENVAKRANELIKKLERYLESGDHDGLVTLEFIIMEEGYRLHGTPIDDIDENDEEVEPLEFDAESIDKVLEKFRL